MFSFRSRHGEPVSLPWVVSTATVMKNGYSHDLRASSSRMDGHERDERGRHTEPFSLPYPLTNPTRCHRISLRSKGWVLAMLGSACAWLRFPAAPPLTFASPDGLPEGRSAPRNIGLGRSLQGTLEKAHMSFSHQSRGRDGGAPGRCSARSCAGSITCGHDGRRFRMTIGSDERRQPHPGEGGSKSTESCPTAPGKPRRKPQTRLWAAPRARPHPRRLASCGEPTHDRPSGAGNWR